MPPFIPDDFEPPTALDAARFHLRPLGPEHNDRGLSRRGRRAWRISDRLRASPADTWPHEMTLAENLRRLRRHADDFAARQGFTYTVLTPDEVDVIGCVYIYPAKRPGFDASAAPGSAPRIVGSMCRSMRRSRCGWRRRGPSRAWTTRPAASTDRSEAADRAFPETSHRGRASSRRAGRPAAQERGRRGEAQPANPSGRTGRGSMRLRAPRSTVGFGADGVIPTPRSACRRLARRVGA